MLALRISKERPGIPHACRAAPCECFVRELEPNLDAYVVQVEVVVGKKARAAGRARLSRSVPDHDLSLAIGLILAFAPSPSPSTQISPVLTSRLITLFKALRAAGQQRFTMHTTSCPI